ncbi:MAG: hypothetical protein P8184_05105 [Calditrichia bacterium]
MEYYRHGRTLVPMGGVFDDADSAIQFAAEFETGVRTEQVKSLQFTVNEDGYLNIFIGEEPFFLTYPALKDVCRMLKLPASFINKFPPSGLMLENLNQNPYKKEDAHTIKLITWKWEENQVIAGFLPMEVPHIPIGEYLTTLKDEGVFNRDDAKLDSIVVNGEEVVLYFLLPEEMAQEGFSFNAGYSLHYCPAQTNDTVIYPFYHMAVTTQTGELFDFDFESAKKLHIAKRKKKDFEQVTMELSTQYAGEDLGVDFENNLKRGITARRLSSLKFALLKTLKSRATSIYSYNGIKVETGAIVEEVVPEFKQFVQSHREQLKTKENYETNSMAVDFYLPLFYNRIFTFRSSSENPYFFVRYRRSIGKMFDKILEETGDIIL